MNNQINIIRLNYLLGFIDSNTIISWADDEINKGNNDEDILELSSTNFKKTNEIISLLNSLSKKENINSEELKKYFFNVFSLELVRDKDNLIKIEEFLIVFYRNIKDLIPFTDEEDLSYSIINNDIILRKEGYHSQLNFQDIENLLMHNIQIK